MPVSISADMSVGERIRAWRMYRGMTQEQCAGLVGRSLSWWKKVEAGLRHVERLSDLVLIAQVLKVKYLEDITGALEISLSRDRIREHPMRPHIQEAMRAAVAPQARSDGEPVPLAHLRARLSEAWVIYRDHPRLVARLADVVPRLLGDAADTHHRSQDLPARRAAAAVLCEVYILISRFLRHVSAFDLARTASDRAMLLACEADEPVILTLAAWQTAGVLKDLGTLDEAVQTCLDAIPILEPYLADASDNVLAAWGHLQLQAGLNAGHLTDEGTALRYWDTGEEVMRRLPADYVHPVTAFSHGEVGVFAIRTYTALGRNSAALQASHRLDISTVPVRASRALGLIDVARGHVARRQNTAAMHILRQAETESSETVEHNVYVREITRLLLRTADRNLGREAHEFAQRIGVFAS